MKAGTTSFDPLFNCNICVFLYVYVYVLFQIYTSVYVYGKGDTVVGGNVHVCA